MPAAYFASDIFIQADFIKNLHPIWGYYPPVEALLEFIALKSETLSSFSCCFLHLTLLCSSASHKSVVV